MNKTSIDIGILTVIPAELDAILAVLGVRRDDRTKASDGTNYWKGAIRSNLVRRDYEFALACIGDAGNVNSAIATNSLIREFSPKIVFLMGIAAGIRGKIKIGEVVLSIRVYAYETASLEKKGRKSITIPRPEIPHISYAVEQDIVAYHPEGKRLIKEFNRVGGIFPKPPRGSARVYKDSVTTSLQMRTSTIASGEKLLRNPELLKFLRQNQHGKIEVGEMEAWGLAQACQRAQIPWLAIRAISDFGDSLKADVFHVFAAKSAAVVMADFIKYGLDLDYKERVSHVRGGETKTNATFPKAQVFLHERNSKSPQGAEASETTQGENNDDETLTKVRQKLNETLRLAALASEAFERDLLPKGCDAVIEDLRMIISGLQELSLVFTSDKPLSEAIIQVRNSFSIQWFRIDEQVQSITSHVDAFRSVCLDQTPARKREKQRIQAGLTDLTKKLETMYSLLS